MVLGFVALERNWFRFERRWNKVLSDFEVPYFHMTEYAHSIPGTPYETWKGREKRRARFMERLIQAVDDGHSRLFSAGVLMSDFHAVDASYTLKEAFGADRPDAGAFAFCAGNCWQLIENWAEREQPQGEIAHVFEAGDRGRGAFEALMRSEHREEIPLDFLAKKDAQTGARVRQFEACDLVAWEYRNLYVSIAEEGNVPERESLRALVRSLTRHMPGIFTEDDLLKICRARPDRIKRRDSG